MSDNNSRAVPDHWTCKPLSETVEILDSQRVPINATERQERTNGLDRSELYPYYGATGQVGWIDDYLFDEELVLLGEDGAPFLDPFRPVAYMVRGKTWVNNHAHVIKAKVGVSINKYIKHFLNTVDYHDYVTGTTRLKLNQGRMKEIDIFLPPLPEQHRIIEKIEELFSQLDAGIAALETAKKQLHRYRQSVLQAAVEGRLTRAWHKQQDHLEPADKLLERILEERRKGWERRYRTVRYDIKGKEPPKGWKDRYSPPSVADFPPSHQLPKGWTWTNLEQLKTYSLYGPRYSSNDYKDEGYLVLRTTDISESGKVDESNAPRIPLSKEELAKYGLQRGDLLITRTGSIGRLAVLDDKVDAIAGAYLIQYRLAHATTLPWYVFLFLRSPTGNRQLTQGSAGVGRPNLNAPTIESIHIPLPPLEEQRHIIEEVERLLSVADDAEKTVEHELKRAERLRQSILKQAFSGKLVTPASNGKATDKVAKQVQEAEAATQEAAGQLEIPL